MLISWYFHFFTILLSLSIHMYKCVYAATLVLHLGLFNWLPCQTLRVWDCCTPTQSKVHLNIQGSFCSMNHFPRALHIGELKCHRCCCQRSMNIILHVPCWWALVIICKMASQYFTNKEKWVNSFLKWQNWGSSVWTAISLSTTLSF